MTDIINIYSAQHGKSGLIQLGYLTTESFNPELCLNLLNWHHRKKHDQRPENLHLYGYDKVDGCRGICFENTSDHTWHLALSLGWLSGSREEIDKYIEENKNQRLWLKD